MTTPHANARLSLASGDLRELLQDLADARVPSLHSPEGSIRAFTALRDASRTAAAAPAFFAPNTTYTEDQPFRAPEERQDFICHGTGVNPADGTLMALGYARPGSTSPWMLAACTQDTWDKGWFAVAADPATGIPVPPPPLQDTAETRH